MSGAWKQRAGRTQRPYSSTLPFSLGKQPIGGEWFVSGHTILAEDKLSHLPTTYFWHVSFLVECLRWDFRVQGPSLLHGRYFSPVIIMFCLLKLLREFSELKHAECSEETWNIVNSQKRLFSFYFTVNLPQGPSHGHCYFVRHCGTQMPEQSLFPRSILYSLWISLHVFYDWFLLL